MSTTKRHVVGAVVMLTIFATGPVAWAQNAPAATFAAAAPKAPPVPLKVTVVISRFQDEKRTSNLPYVLSVNSGGNSSLRMNNNVPMPTGPKLPEGVTMPVQNVTYQSVGTSIDCTVEAAAIDGVFQFFLTVVDSQVVAAKPGTPQTSSLASLPYIQNFTSTTRLGLRDGQTAQITAAVDKATGEVVKLEVTVNVMK